MYTVHHSMKNPIKKTEVINPRTCTRQFYLEIATPKCRRDMGA